MKNLVLGLIVIVGILTVGRLETTYTKEGIYLGNNTVMTHDGNLWEYENVKADIGDSLKITFNNNGTDNNYYDDVIIKIKNVEK